MTTAQELLNAGVNPNNIPTLTQELNKPEFGGLADTEFMVEAGRFGRTDATTQLGLDWWWDTQGKHTQIFDTGESFDISERGGKGWSRQGGVVSKGELPEGIKNTADEWAKAVGYKDGADWFYTQKAKGNIREGLTFKEWQKDMLELGKDQTLVMYAQAINPLQPETWTHELGHIGQDIIRAGGLDLDKIKVPWYKDRPTDPFKDFTKEAKQRVRDIMMSSPGQGPYDEAHDWLQRSRKDDKGKPSPYTEKEIRDIEQQVLLEDELANLKLESRWGFTLPSGDLSQYEEQHMPGFWQSMTNKAKGWFK
jgi:hypothetical protein